MDDFKNKVLSFNTALKDMYRDEEQRESECIPKIELKEESLTEDFTAMIYAVFILYKEITGDDTDIIGFTHICNRFVFQNLMGDKEGVSE